MSGHHAHDHNHHGHDHDGHDHSNEIEPALQTLLWRQIDFEAISTLNEAETGSGSAIVEKTWPQRMNAEPELESDADEQLLMFVPFAGQVKLQSILIRTADDSSAPKTVKLFVNRENLDFDRASEADATERLELAQDSRVLEYPVKRNRFTMTRSLTLFFEENWGAETTKISYLGFKGEFMPLSKEPVSVLYESAANPADHKRVPVVGMTAVHDLDPSTVPRRHGM